MKKLFLAILSGLILGLSWPSIGNSILLFCGFIPLFILEDIISVSNESKKGRSIFLYSFISFLIFNVVTTYWVCNATIFGGIFAFLVNTTLMSLVVYCFHKIRLITGDRLGFISFILLWISMEYLHLNWGFSWPWLTLGNGLANFSSLIQWYDITGVLGGTLVILLINLLFYQIYLTKKSKNLIYIFFIFLLMFSFSFVSSVEINDNKLNVLVVQPNIDPYKEKFDVDFQDQINEFIHLAESNLNHNVELLIGPETAIQEGLWEHQIEQSYSINKFREMQDKYPDLNILIGATTYKIIQDHAASSSTREMNNGLLYEIYNSAIFIPDSGDIKIYHKTKLVPGVEKIPFPFLFGWLSSLMVDLGGVSGSLGSSNILDVFDLDRLKVLPLICYESVYGDLISEKYSDIICIITNDGWWGNTAGYKQHFLYSKLRAIEQRKAVVRSANTGISGVINSHGKILIQTDWNQSVCFLSSIETNNNRTFYNHYGDYIGRIGSFVSLILVLTVFVKSKIN